MDSQGKRIAALALGSNLGDRFQNIEAALRCLEMLPRLSSSPISGTLNVVDTSFMYETAPMYVLSQPAFANCACLVSPIAIYSPLTITGAHVATYILGRNITQPS